MLRLRNVVDLVIMVAAIIVIITLVIHQIDLNACNPGPKPIAWSWHEYKVYLENACK